MDIDPEIIAYAATLILGILSAIFGKKWAAAKEKFALSEQKVLKVAAALKATSDAIKDDIITPEEEQAIVKNWKDIIDEAKYLLK